MLVGGVADVWVVVSWPPLLNPINVTVSTLTSEDVPLNTVTVTLTVLLVFEAGDAVMW
jgi:hypothetical protein